MIGRLLYGGLFVIVLPALLIAWATGANANVALPVYGNIPAGAAFATTGLALIAIAMWQLWHDGGGLPMNAFPPPKLVTHGLFHWVPHPIYTGFVMLCLGASMIARSSAGLWLVTPTVALACAALVLGYERIDMQKRFGGALTRLLPPDDDRRPSVSDGIRFVIIAVIPWLALYEFTTHMGLRGTAFAFPFEDHLPIYAWTAIVYETSYLTVTFAPTWTRTNHQLRQLMITAWVATALIYPIYWIAPSAAPRRPMLDDSWIAHLLFSERSALPPTAAFPSFHVLWAVFVGRLWPKWLWVAYSLLIATSCVTTGMHYIPDVLAALLIAPLLLEPQRRLWIPLLRLTERVANSWTEWRIGPVRIIDHAVFATAAAFVPVALMAAAAGPKPVLAAAFAGLIGAALWAQWVEGASMQRRVYGFYGGFFGVALASALFEDRWLLWGACCLGAPWMQAIGRLRCLVNGCCHGAPAPGSHAGICVTHERSRVTRMAGLGGVPIYPTQLYSILSNVFLGLILMRLWMSGSPLSLVCGVYLIGNGLARFVEEAYRGEPQTAIRWGLRLYQWLAVAFVVAGAGFTTLSTPAAPTLAFTPAGLALAAIFGPVAGIALSVDLPDSQRPLARLT